MVSFRFSRPRKSHLTYQLLAMINSGRLKMDQADEAPPMIAEEAWKQLRLARYRVPAPVYGLRTSSPRGGQHIVALRRGDGSRTVFAFLQRAETHLGSGLMEQRGQKLLRGKRAAHQSSQRQRFEALLLEVDVHAAGVGIQLQAHMMARQLGGHVVGPIPTIMTLGAT
jgi:hypothetical protein